MLKLASIRAAASAFFGLGRARALRVKVPKHARSKYTPHYGAKEQERSKRFEMSHAHANFPYGARSTPTMQRISNRDYEEMLEIRRMNAA